MEWLIHLFRDADSAAHTVLVISLVAAGGLALGSVRLFGVNLGIAGVLFAGLLFGHCFGRWHIQMNAPVMEFAREFGLVIFVYTIGLQVGPGFLASLRRQGLPLNLLAGLVVLLGAALAVLFGQMGLGTPVAVGLFAGATTNTPSLAAAQQALKDVPACSPELIKLPGLAYAIAYPFGIIGVILTMILTRRLFRIDVAAEREEVSRLQNDGRPALATGNYQVRNPNLQGVAIKDLPLVDHYDVVISRILKANQPHVPQIARPETTLDLGDVVLAVGPKERLDQLRLLIGSESSVDLRTLRSNIVTRRIVITRRAALGRTIQELDLVRRHGVNITRVSRAEVDFAPTPGFRTQFGDTVLAVGDSAGVDQVAAELGNSLRQLNHPQLVPVFVGLALGVLLGSWPITVPGMPAPVKLGLAGGPLLVAIILSRVGHVGPLIWYMPISANFMLREVGITLFLACVGLRAGDSFLKTLVSGSGLLWVLAGAAITLLPLLAAAAIARRVFKMNYLHVCGLLAGSMTDPPALAFATTIAGSEAPSVSYSTVYPAVMLLRVICAQAMVLLCLPS
ncbi:MAG: putative transporter [Phycisphaerae bacterium]|jgi:putative transport protein